MIYIYFLYGPFFHQIAALVKVPPKLCLVECFHAVSSGRVQLVHHNFEAISSKMVWNVHLED